MPGLIENVLLAAGLAFAAALQPGPFLAFLVSRAVANGGRDTVPACFAPLVSDLPGAVLALVVVGRMPSTAQHLLRAGGGLLLLYLALSAFRQWSDPAPPSRGSAPRTLLEAVMINVLNPNAYLGWALILGPAVLAAWRVHPLHAVGFVASFYLTMSLTLVVFVLLVGTARALDAGRRRALVGLSVILLAGLGLTLLVLGVRGVWSGTAAG